MGSASSYSHSLNMGEKQLWDVFHVLIALHHSNSAPSQAWKRPHQVQPSCYPQKKNKIKGQCGDEPDCTVHFNQPLINSCQDNCGTNEN